MEGFKLYDFTNDYENRCWAVIPAKTRDKAPAIKSWNNVTSTNPVTRSCFADDSNLSIVLGENSGGLVDIDVDHEPLLRAAELLLPETGVVFGRKSNPDSHRIYQVASSGSTEKFQLKGLGTLVEYRATGASTVFPSSVHFSGEQVSFSAFGEPAEVSREELLKSVRRLAAVGTIGSAWRGGSRHDVALALSGALANAGWSKDKAQVIVEAICMVAEDDDLTDRLRAVDDTLSAIVRVKTTPAGLGSLSWWVKRRSTRSLIFSVSKCLRRLGKTGHQQMMWRC